jgi:hypothetical protein
MAKSRKKQFIEYCNENWDLEWYESAKALDVMDKMRCPLSMANEVVSNHIRDLADDFELENDLDDDWYDNTFDNDEDVFMQLDIFDNR